MADAMLKGGKGALERLLDGGADVNAMSRCVSCSDDLTIVLQLAVIAGRPCAECNSRDMADVCRSVLHNVITVMTS